MRNFTPPGVILVLLQSREIGELIFATAFVTAEGLVNSICYAGPTWGWYKRYIVPGPGKMKLSTLNFSVTETEITSVKPLAWITINVLVDLSMTADSDYYTNMLYKFRRAWEARGRGVSLRTPDKIILGGPAPNWMIFLRSWLLLRVHGTEWRKCGLTCRLRCYYARV